MHLQRLLQLPSPLRRYISSASSIPFSYNSPHQTNGGDDPNGYPENQNQVYGSNPAAGTPINPWGHQSPAGYSVPGNNQQYVSTYSDPAAGNYSNFSSPGTTAVPSTGNYAQFSNSGPAAECAIGNCPTGTGFRGSAQNGYSGFPVSSAGDNYNSPASQVINNFQSPSFTSTTSATGNSSLPFVSQRSYGFSSAEEAAAERRRRKRRLRIEPPLYALHPNPPNPSNANSPDKPRLPDSTSALVGPRLNLHNRVQSLIRAGDLDSASYVARQSAYQYIRPTVFTCNAIIAAMYRAKRYSDAKALFQYFFRQFEIIPNVVSYNNLIASHCESNEVDEALKVYQYILENAPYSPSAVTYRHLTKGLIDAGRIEEAVSLLREMLHKGHGADSLVFNNVILGYLNLGNLDKANELFDELKERCTVYDGVVNATFMDWFFNQGKPREAMESYRDLMARNYRMVPATRNVLLETLLKHGKKKEAWDLFHGMLDDHTPPTFQAVNSDTVSMMVNECLKEGNIEEAMDVFQRSGKAVKSKPFQMDVAGFNNMISRMSELEMMDKAEVYYKQLCDKSLSPDVNTYKTLIEAYIKLDMVDNMVEKFTRMVEAGLRVIPPYANKWFGYMIEKGMSGSCVLILEKMVEREPKPDVTTYDIVLRGLVDEGHFDASANLIKEMVNHGVGATASLREFLLQAFESVDRRAEIENALNQFQIQQSNLRPYSSPRRSPRMMEVQGDRAPAMPWQTNYTPRASSYANQWTQQSYQPMATTEQQWTQQSYQPEQKWNQLTYQPMSTTEQYVHQQQGPGQEAETPQMAGQQFG